MITEHDKLQCSKIALNLRFWNGVCSSGKGEVHSDHHVTNCIHSFIPTEDMYPNNHMCARAINDLSGISKESNFVMKNMSVSYTSQSWTK